MQCKIWVSLALSIFALSNLAKAQPRGVFEDAKYALVKIQVYKATQQKFDHGTGFIIDSTDSTLTILTNRHVVAQEDPAVKWEWPDGLWLKPCGQMDSIKVENGNIYFFPDGEDVAILKVERRRILNFRVPLCLSERLQIDGTDVRALTYPPKDLLPRTTDGEISSRDNPFYNIAFDIKRPFENGESGSPVLHRQLGIVVVGMVTRKDNNRVLQSVQVRSTLERFKVYPPSCREEKKILALPPFDFEPEEKQPKWSKQLIEHLVEFISHSQEIKTSSGHVLNKQLRWIMHPRPGDSLSIDQLNELPSYIVRGNGQKQDDLFVLNFSLRWVPGEELVMSKHVAASDLRNLADSVGVQLLRYFRYQTKFVGVPYVWRKWSLRATLAGILPTVVMWPVAANSKSGYKVALSSKEEVESSYSRMHRDEFFRNAAAIITGTSLVIWSNAALRNPRRPVFEKIEVK